MDACKVAWAVVFLGCLGTSFSQYQIQYRVRRFSTFQAPTQAQGLVFGQPQIIFGQQNAQPQQGNFGQENSGDGIVFVPGDSRRANRDSINTFGSGQAFSGVNPQPGRTFRDIYGDDAGRPGGVFPGTSVSFNVLRNQLGNTFGAGGFAGSLPSAPGVFRPQFGGNLAPASTFQFEGDRHPAFQPLNPSFAGSSRIIQARPDVTQTRSETVDRFITTTDEVFVNEPRTATLFGFVTQTSATTVVAPTPVTVTSVKSEFQFVTLTERQYVTLTHTARAFTHETLTTTVTSVQTMPTTLVRTIVVTVTTTFTASRIITSAAFTGGYY